MVHEEAADQQVAVSEPLGLNFVGKQQEPWILHAAAGEDEDLCDDQPARARQAAGLNVIDGGGSRIRLDVGHIRVDKDLDIVALLDLGPIYCVELSRRAESPVVDLQQVPADLRRPYLVLLPIAFVIDIGTDLQDRVSPLVEGIEVGPGNWPAAIGNVRSCFEIDLAQRAAPAVPVIGRAAEVAKPASVQVVVR